MKKIEIRVPSTHHSCSQPTYKELKLFCGYDDSKQIIRSQPTYKELKLRYNSVPH